MTLLAALALLLTSAPALADHPGAASHYSAASHFSAAATASRVFHDVLLKCPARVWPGVDWSELQILFSDSRAKDAWLVGRAYRQPARTTKDQTIEDLFEPGFTSGFLEFRGRHTLAVSTDPGSDEAAVRTAVTGLFKEAAQAEWENPVFDDRGHLFPLLPEPRYFRRMVQVHLLQAVELLAAGRDLRPALETAAWWQARWKKYFPEELAFRTEASEGTALYAEQTARLLSSLGCSASVPAFRDGLRRVARSELTLETGAFHAREGALIGALSSFLLSALQPGWQKRMNGRLMPSDLLLAGLGLRPEAEQGALLRQYREVVGRQQAKARARLEPELLRARDPGFVRVSVPSAWLKGELGVGESYVHRANKAFAYFFLDAAHQFEGDYGLARLHARAALHQGPNPCGGGGLSFLVPASAVKAGPPEGLSRVYSGSFAGGSFRVRGVAKTLAGYPWICPWL